MIFNDRRRSPTACRRLSPIVTDHIGTRLYQLIHVYMELVAPETFERGFLSNENLIKFDKKKNSHLRLLDMILFIATRLVGYLPSHLQWVLIE